MNSSKLGKKWCENVSAALSFSFEYTGVVTSEKLRVPIFKLIADSLGVIKYDKRMIKRDSKIWEREGETGGTRA